MIDITVNGAPHQLADASTLADLADVLQLAGRRYAIELNQQVIPRRLHAETQLHAGDRLEVVIAVGGG